MLEANCPSKIIQKQISLRLSALDEDSTTGHKNMQKPSMAVVAQQWLPKICGAQWWGEGLCRLQLG